MGRTIGPKNKIARRFGMNLGLKTNATKVARRLTQPPGQHGPSKKSNRPATGYGKQLLEKQKAKFVYGLRERQFRKYVTEATRVKGNSGTFLQQLLERRFDNVIYRLGFAVTRAQARQMVGHGMFFVNDKALNIPSYLVKAGDVISLKPSKAKKKLFETITDQLGKKEAPSWLTIDAVKKTAKVIGTPSDRDFEKTFDIRLIIQFYSAR